MREEPSPAMYLAVLPAYRQRCVDRLLSKEPSLRLYCSSAHLDRSVRTGIRQDQYQTVKMLRIAGRMFIQFGFTTAALRASVLIVDLNPRSASAWLLLALRRALGRRTLVWGHLYPQAGAGSKTRAMRRAMRRLAHGTVSYTYSNAASARSEMPDRPVWVAPNALYTREELASTPQTATQRNNLLYVGRLESAKKLDLLITAFANSACKLQGAHLTLVGDGALRPRLEELARQLGISASVTFHGWVEDLDSLRNLYSRSFASTSPGFAGLGVTQSLGFGVPIIVSRDEPHSPEIELAELGGVIWADSGDAQDWARRIDLLWSEMRPIDLQLAMRVRELYSADAMADGLMSAIEGKESEYDS